MSSLDALSTTLWLLLCDVAVKGTAILVMTFGVAHLARAATAATVHRIWMTGLAAILLLPVARLALPRLRAPMVPAAAAIFGTPTTIDDGAATRDIADAGTTNRRSGRQAEMPGAAVSGPTRSRPVAALLAVWISGVMVVLLRLLFGTFVVWRRSRQATINSDPTLLVEVQRLARLHGVRRHVRVLQGGTDCSPMTWGTLSPVLLLPPDARQWTNERRGVVLLHEVAHVARFDSALQLVAQCAAALCWFQPLVWMAVRRARLHRERACDDFVLASGARASDYAADLLALASPLDRRELPAFTALAAVGRSELESRIRAILNAATKRDARPRGWSLGATASLAAVLPFAMLQPTPGGLQSGPGAASRASAACAVARTAVDSIWHGQTPSGCTTISGGAAATFDAALSTVWMRAPEEGLRAAASRDVGRSERKVSRHVANAGNKCSERAGVDSTEASLLAR